ncbi:hypothetical protein HYX05_01050 [Candidatus Woesearchaeota archaeon]|nr:hypothetical protein [Candidatus Woesearchaeota archaeon]
MPSKKSQSISINTIIIAAIALAVLVVLFFVFTGRFKVFSEGVGQTASCSNSCRALGMSLGVRTGSSLQDAAEDCRRQSDRAYIPGTYADITESNGVCCCQK